jgi:hypothetical protein
MPYCPKCRFEYVEGIERCPDCDVDLVDELAPEKPAEHEREKPLQLVTVAMFNFHVDAEMAKLKLESEGIEVVLANEVLSRLDGPIMQYYPIKVQVRAEDVDRAKEILK